MSLEKHRTNALPAVTLHRRWQFPKLGKTADQSAAVRKAGQRYVRGLPTVLQRLLLTGCVLLPGTAGAVHLANAQELSSRVQLAKLGLPAIESLTFESDYTVFMAPSVPSLIRRQALRKLWSFPVFNQTDGLLTYAGDYTIQTDAHGKRVQSASFGLGATQAMAQ